MRKTRKGGPTNFIEAALIIERGEYLYVHEKPMHPAWMKRLQLGTFLDLARSGALRLALDAGGRPYRSNTPDDKATTT